MDHNANMMEGKTGEDKIIHFHFCAEFDKFHNLNYDEAESFYIVTPHNGVSLVWEFCLYAKGAEFCNLPKDKQTKEPIFVIESTSVVKGLIGEVNFEMDFFLKHKLPDSNILIPSGGRDELEGWDERGYETIEICPRDSNKYKFTKGGKMNFSVRISTVKVYDNLMTLYSKHPTQFTRKKDKKTVPFRLHLRVPEKYFSAKNIIDVFREQLPPSKTLNFAALYGDVELLNSCKPLKPGTDKPSRLYLDFQVNTVDEVTIWCHKVVLCKMNVYFQRVVESPASNITGEKTSTAVPFDSKVMQEIIRFIYTGEVSPAFPSGPWNKHVTQLLEAADYFQLENVGFKLHCEERLIEEFHKTKEADKQEVVFQSLELSEFYRMTTLGNVVLTYVLDNYSKYETEFNERVSKEWKAYKDLNFQRFRRVPESKNKGKTVVSLFDL